MLKRGRRDTVGLCGIRTPCRKALSNQDLVAVVTYLLARYPDTFPPLLDDALSSISPKQAANEGVHA